MTKEQVERLNLGLEPIDARSILLVESGLNWVNDNTDLNIDYNSDESLNSLPASIKLFVIKYIDLMLMPTSVTSESIEGLSQSYNTSNKSDLIWQYAYELLGNHICSQMSFVSAKKRWC